MINWPEALVEAIARRRCVLFLGSGNQLTPKIAVENGQQHGKNF